MKKPIKKTKKIYLDLSRYIDSIIESIEIKFLISIIVAVLSLFLVNFAINYKLQAWSQGDQYLREDSTIGIHAFITNPSQRQFSKNYQISFGDIWIANVKNFLAEMPKNTDYVCIESLKIRISTKDSNTDRFYSLSDKSDELILDGANQLCQEIDQSKIVNAQDIDTNIYLSLLRFNVLENLNLDLDFDSNTYYLYPFDYFYVNFASKADFAYYDINKNKIDSKILASELLLNNKLENWDISNKSILLDKNEVSYSVLKKINPRPFSVNFRRPWVIKAITIAFFIIIVSIPASMPLLNSISEILGLGTAYFLGIWGFRQVIIQENYIGLNMVDIIFAGSYFLVAMSILLSLVFISRPQKNKNVFSKNLIIRDNKSSHRNKRVFKRIKKEKESR